jgi:hypothetical protein
MDEKIFKFSDREEKFQVLMITHFPGVTVREVEKLSCEICQDFKEKYCVGKNLKAKEAARCMWDRAGEADVEVEIHKTFIQ